MNRKTFITKFKIKLYLYFKKLIISKIKQIYQSKSLMMIYYKMKKIMRFKYNYLIILNNLKKNMLISFTKYQILILHTRYYMQIIFKRNYQIYSQRCTLIKRKSNKALQMKIFLKIKQQMYPHKLIAQLRKATKKINLIKINQVKEIQIITN